MEDMHKGPIGKGVFRISCYSRKRITDNGGMISDWALVLATVSIFELEEWIAIRHTKSQPWDRQEVNLILEELIMR